MEGKKGISEDWLSVWFGLFVFILGLWLYIGIDFLGWAVKTNMWVSLNKATLSPVSGTIQGLPGITSLLLTYFFMLAIMVIGAAALGARIERFILGFSLVFWLAYGCFLLGNYAYIAANTDALLKQFGIGWSLKLTPEAGLIMALIGGLIVGNFFPRFAETLKEATRPELYIKTAIVILGAALGVKAAGALGLASNVLFRGLCAIIEAYLIYWAIVYFISRKYFKFSREWAAQSTRKPKLLPPGTIGDNKLRAIFSLEPGPIDFGPRAAVP